MKRLPTETAEYKKIMSIINKWLKIRDKSNNYFWHKPSEEDKNLPKYVIEMIREIDKFMPYSCLDEIKSLDAYNSGYIDYVSKFALHCTELYFELKEK